MGDIFWWPLAFAFGGLWFVFVILVAAFWIWMIVDCAQRDFTERLEKIIWILVIVFTTWVGALVYFLVVKYNNPNGLMHPR